MFLRGALAPARRQTAVDRSVIGGANCCHGCIKNTLISQGRFLPPLKEWVSLARQTQPMDEHKRTLVIPEIPPSQNEFNAASLRKRLRHKRLWMDQVFYATRVKQTGLVVSSDPIPDEWYPVEIQVRCGFPRGRRRYDAGNLSAAEKHGVDQLIKMGILKGDSSRYVRRVVLGPCFRVLPGECETGYTEIIIRSTNATL